MYVSIIKAMRPSSPSKKQSGAHTQAYVPIPSSPPKKSRRSSLPAMRPGRKESISTTEDSPIKREELSPFASLFDVVQRELGSIDYLMAQPSQCSASQETYFQASAATSDHGEILGLVDLEGVDSSDHSIELHQESGIATRSFILNPLGLLDNLRTSRNTWDKDLLKINQIVDQQQGTSTSRSGSNNQSRSADPVVISTTATATATATATTSIAAIGVSEATHFDLGHHQGVDLESATINQSTLSENFMTQAQPRISFLALGILALFVVFALLAYFLIAK